MKYKIDKQLIVENMMVGAIGMASFLGGAKTMQVANNAMKPYVKPGTSEMADTVSEF